MKINHKVLKDFQLVLENKSILVLKSGYIIENYKFKSRDSSIDIDPELINKNADYFQLIDWKSELLIYLKQNKISPPSQIQKKIIPFIEDMILSSMGESGVVDDERLKDIERKEVDLNNRDKRIRSKEEEIEIRSSRVEKREESYKEDLKILDKKEDDIRIKSREVTERELDIQDKLQDINEKERNIEKSSLESIQDIDGRYTDLKNKIEGDIKVVSDKEKELESLSRDIKRREDIILQKESDINDMIRDFDIRKEEFSNWSDEVIKLDNEIKEWENLHWKFKRMKKPPSVQD